MQLIHPRAEITPFPIGDNTTDLLYHGIHLNLTTARFWNYTLYDNGTLSNDSDCWLILKGLHPVPVLLSNGTFVNGTWCYDPYWNISQRGSLGIVFACLFAATIMFTLVNLRKHGQLFLPSQVRFRAIGRRWQWYWMLFVATCGIISGITSIDVDRDYLQSLSIILQTFFYYLMMPGILAVVWEGVRHWASWQERQIYDSDPFSLPQDDRRGRTEFYLPLAFYAFAWLNFFMNIPRNWGGIQSQGSNQQINTIAEPSATDTRFKAGGILAFFAWCVICFSIRQSIHYYKPRNRGLFNSFIGFLHFCPKRFILNIALLLVVVGYATAGAFVWEINPANLAANKGWLYGLGYAPIVAILAVNEISGLTQPNEDRELQRQRIERGQRIDAEIGIRSHRKPWWWRGALPTNNTTMGRLKNLTTEIGGGRATSRNLASTIELGNMPIRPRDGENVNPFRDNAEEAPRPRYMDDPDRRPVLGGIDNDDDDSSGRAMSQRTVSTVGSRPQQVKSMLDV